MSFEDLIAPIEADLLSDHLQRADMLGKAAEALSEAGDEQGAERMSFLRVAFQFLPREPGTTGAYFRPMIVWEDGRAYPTIEGLREEAWPIYRGEAARTPNDVMRARYADLVWEQSGEHSFARIAAEAYLAWARVYLDAHLSGASGAARLGVLNEMSQAIRRVIEVGTQLNSDDLVGNAAEQGLDAVGRLLDVGEPRWCLDQVAAILENRRAREIVGLQRLAKSIDEVVAAYTAIPEDQEPWHLLRSALALRVRWAQLAGDTEREREARIEHAASYVSEAAWKGANYDSGNMVAARLTRQAIDDYRLAGRCQDEIDACLVALEKFNRASIGEMKRISVPLEIPKEDFEAFQKRMVDFADATGPRFLQGPDILPDVQAIRDEVRDRCSGALAALFCHVAVDDSRVVHESTNVDEYAAAEVIRSITMYVRLAAASVHWGIDHLVEGGRLDAQELTKLIAECNVIRQWRADTLSVAFERLIAEDYVSFMHIAMAQIEGILRDLLPVVGRPTTYVHGSGANLARPLNDILRDERLAAAIGENLIETLRAVLVEHPGLNLRNELAHGLLPLEAFDRLNATIVLLLLLQLATLRGEQTQGEERDSDQYDNN